MIIPPSKSLLRRELRTQRRRLSVAQQCRAAQAMCRHFLRLPGLRAAKTVALYLACDGEISPAPLVRHLGTLGKQVYLPRINCNGSVMTFARYQPGDKVQRHQKLGIWQPLPKAPLCSVVALDIVGLPLVGFDERGNRLGMGGGFYDRVFNRRTGRRPLLVGLAHAGQQVAQLPVEPWDAPLDWVTTDMGLHACRRVRLLMGKG
ncbi:MAG: hypothetical protein RL497_507 [Pseudomonadota bacterium]|jgi:5-formyltetrahydrofolate cyclo-ligase